MGCLIQLHLHFFYLLLGSLFSLSSSKTTARSSGASAAEPTDSSRGAGTEGLGALVGRRVARAGDGTGERTGADHGRNGNGEDLWGNSGGMGWGEDQ